MCASLTILTVFCSISGGDWGVVPGSTINKLVEVMSRAVGSISDE